MEELEVKCQIYRRHVEELSDINNKVMSNRITSGIYAQILHTGCCSAAVRISIEDKIKSLQDDCDKLCVKSERLSLFVQILKTVIMNELNRDDKDHNDLYETYLELQ